MDIQILNTIAAQRSDGMTSVMLFFSQLGGSVVAIVLLLLVVCYLIFKLDKLDEAIMLSASLAFSQILAHTIKYIIQRPRPALPLAIYSEYGYSMPSAHAFLATAFYGMLMILLARQFKQRSAKFVIYALFSAIIAAICFSRIYLGVHWATDVIAGAVGGILLDCVILLVAKEHAQRGKKRLHQAQR